MKTQNGLRASERACVRAWARVCNLEHSQTMCD